MIGGSNQQDEWSLLALKDIDKQRDTIITGSTDRYVIPEVGGSNLILVYNW